MPKPQYGAAHQRARAKVKAEVEQGIVACCLCGHMIEQGQAWDLDHQPGADTYRGPAHASCNRSDGAVRGNRARGKQNKTTCWLL